MVVAGQLSRPRHHHGQRDPRPGRRACGRYPHVRQRDPQLLGPAARRQDRPHPGPGRTTCRSLRPITAGTYRGQCAEFCGLEHARMAFQVIVDEPCGLRAVGRRSAPDPARRPPIRCSSRERDLRQRVRAPAATTSPARRRAARWGPISPTSGAEPRSPPTRSRTRPADMTPLAVAIPSRSNRER